MEDVIDVAQVPMVVEGVIEVFFGQLLSHDWVGFQERAVRNVVGPALGGVLLDQVVGVLTGHPGVNQLEQYPAGVNQAQGFVHVVLHPVREDVQVLDDLAEAVEHVVQQRRGVRQNHPFGTGVGDVAFVPEGHVFVGGHHVAPQDPGTAADVFGADWIALVRHC